MDWLADNWLWILFAGAFLWMHLKMHGGHSSHGGRGGCCGSHGGHDRDSTVEDRVDAPPRHSVR